MLPPEAEGGGWWWRCYLRSLKCCRRVEEGEGSNCSGGDTPVPLPQPFKHCCHPHHLPPIITLATIIVISTIFSVYWNLFKPKAAQCSSCFVFSASCCALPVSTACHPPDPSLKLHSNGHLHLHCTYLQFTSLYIQKICTSLVCILSKAREQPFLWFRVSGSEATLSPLALQKLLLQV